MTRNRKIKKALTDNLAVSVEVAGRALGVGRSSAYKAVRNGEIPSIKVGRKFVVPTAPLRKMLGFGKKQSNDR